MSNVTPASQDGASDGRSELAERALAFYKDTLQARLEPEHDGKGLAIHPDSGDYAIAPTPTHASRALWQRHPEGGIVTMRIGPTPDFALAARILAGRMTTQLQQPWQTETTPVTPTV